MKHTKSISKHNQRKNKRKSYIRSSTECNSSSYSSSRSRSRRSSSSDSNSSSSSSSRSLSKSPSHFRFRIGQTFKKDKYRVKAHISDGTFGRVLLVEQKHSEKQYAMKIIRPSKSYVESAEIEAEILEDVNRRDERYVVKLKETFHYKSHFIMIFERLGPSLYDVLREIPDRKLPMPYLQKVLYRLIKCIKFLHKNHITHTDLKPENILFTNDEMDKIYNHRTGQVLRLPRNPEIKLIDLGGAVYDDDDDSHTTIVNTRQYRAPEIQLQCCEWGHSSDVWGIGCIAMEMYLGHMLFQTRKNHFEHMALIEKLCGYIPKWMAKRSQGDFSELYSSRHFQELNSYFDWDKMLNEQNKIKVEQMQKLENLIRPEDKEFKNLIEKMMQIDPDERISCSKALDHPFFYVKY